MDANLEDSAMVEEAYEAGEKVVGAFEKGYEIGTQFDQATGASDKLSTAAVDADPELALSASRDWDDANAAWDKGDHVEAIGDGVSAVGKFAVGTAEAAGSAIADGAEAAWDKVTDLF
jgi:hypothetical protein